MTFMPRPNSPAREAKLANHLRTRLGAFAWRANTVRDFSDCPHTYTAFVEVMNNHGVWVIGICKNCGVSEPPQCQHVSNSWNADGSLLTCDNCGIDGT